MKPEQLKKIAESIGHEGFLAMDRKIATSYYIYLEDENPNTHCRMPRKSIKYDPERNAKQRWEILEYLILHVVYGITIMQSNPERIISYENRCIGEGKTLTEAILNAILERIKTNEQE